MRLSLAVPGFWGAGEGELDVAETDVVKDIWAGWELDWLVGHDCWGYVCGFRREVIATA